MARTRHIGVLVVVAALVLWGTAAAATATPAVGAASSAGDASTVQLQQQQEDGNASVSFDDQAVENGTVTVGNITVPEGGYVAIHDDRLLDGEAVESVIGVSEYLEPGTHENVSVTLFEGVPGADTGNVSMPNGTETLIAMPHQETTGNETYEFVFTGGVDDGPYAVDGDAVTDSADVEFAADGDAPAADDDRGLVVESLDAPASAAPNDTITVNATIGNTLDEAESGDVAFRLAGGGADVVVRQNVTVNASASETVTFELNAADVGEGEYIHGVTTTNSSSFAAITIGADEAEPPAEPPGNDTEAPGNDTEAPGNDTQAPGNDTQAPGNDTQAPGNDTQAPGNDTQAPGNDTQAPGNDTQAPGNETDGGDGAGNDTET